MTPIHSFNEIFVPLLKVIGILVTVAIVSLMVKGLFMLLFKDHWHKTIKQGKAVRLDMGNDALDGWYVVKNRIGNTVELIRLNPENSGKNITYIPTDVTCSIEFLKPL